MLLHNPEHIIFWGFAATIVITTVMAASKPLGLSRIDLPFLLGTMFTSNKNKAPFYGFICHLLFGWLFAFIYAIAFRLSGINSLWFALAVAFVHACFVLSAGLQIMAAFHPRMASSDYGPTPTRQLQPPGFFALNYGRGTPTITIISHLIYGAVLGLFL